MEEITLDIVYRMEKENFWHCARRSILEKMIRAFVKGAENDILDVGCGVGADYPLLSQFGSVDNVDCDKKALQYFSNNNPNATVYQGSLPDQLPEVVRLKKYNLIALFDVLEHIQDDVRALIILKSLLKDGGHILLTVPACPFLYRKWDRMSNHWRRYMRSNLKSVIQEAGLSVKFLSYFNFFLFPANVLVCLKEKMSDTYIHEIPNRFINSVCRRIFELEKHFLPRISFPIGMSLIAVISLRNKNS
ncbi:MAG: class I SAM-dependent methyltransferase [Holosporales bacterium]|jgi:SAM-dependent methyltransferase|nr:class I SAM-dependent methyltransferase [Holosporales bacterium]